MTLTVEEGTPVTVKRKSYPSLTMPSTGSPLRVGATAGTIVQENVAVSDSGKIGEERVVVTAPCTHRRRQVFRR